MVLTTFLEQKNPYILFCVSFSQAIRSLKFFHSTLWNSWFHSNRILVPSPFSPQWNLAPPCALWFPCSSQVTAVFWSITLVSLDCEVDILHPHCFFQTIPSLKYPALTLLSPDYISKYSLCLLTCHMIWIISLNFSIITTPDSLSVSPKRLLPSSVVIQ